MATEYQSRVLLGLGRTAMCCPVLSTLAILPREDLRSDSSGGGGQLSSDVPQTCFRRFVSSFSTTTRFLDIPDRAPFLRSHASTSHNGVRKWHMSNHVDKLRGERLGIQEPHVRCVAPVDTSMRTPEEPEIGRHGRIPLILSIAPE